MSLCQPIYPDAKAIYVQITVASRLGYIVRLLGLDAVHFRHGTFSPRWLLECLFGNQFARGVVL